MSGKRILEAWRELLPQGVEISVGPLLDDAPALTPREEKSIGVMDARRTLEFKTGRAYAKLALSKLGFHNVELPVGANRAPIWPEGVSGSITHAAGPTGAHFAAAVAKTNFTCWLGIDAEVPCVLHPSTWTRFLATSELQHVCELPVATRTGVVLTIWCAKEAAAKALGESTDPLAIEVRHGGSLSEAQDVWEVAIRSRTINLQARTMRLPELIMGAVVG